MQNSSNSNKTTNKRKKIKISNSIISRMTKNIKQNYKKKEINNYLLIN